MKNIKVHITDILWRELTDDFPAQRDSDAEKLPYDDVILMYPVTNCFNITYVNIYVNDRMALS